MTTPEDATANVFVARQPIFDCNLEVYGYELLFRSGLEGGFDPDTDGDQATSRVITNSFFLFGIQRVTQGKRAFINFPDHLLLDEIPLLCDRRLTVIEILETVAVTPEIVTACRTFVRKGYHLALDDFVFTPQWEELLDLAHIVKLDVLALDKQELEGEVARGRRHELKLLAEKIETHDQFQQAVDLGFELFQGFFFSRPNILAGRDLPVLKLHLFRLLKMLADPTSDYVKIGRVVAQDVSLAYKLLRFVNSAWFSRRNEITSLQNAVALLGEENFRKWVSLIAVASLADDKPRELAVTAVMRALCCEGIAERCPRLASHAATCYTVGMFSLLDALLDRPMTEVVAELGLATEIAAALLRPLTTPYGIPLLLCRAYEQAEWRQVDDLARRLGIDPGHLPAIYARALETVTLLLGGG